MSAATNNPTPFLFVAVNAAGGKKLGMRAAVTEAALQDSLRRDRLLLLRAWRAPQWAAPADVVNLPLKDQTSLNEQLAALLKRGVPLVDALSVAASVVSPKARAKATRLRELVSAGASFSSACEQVGGFDAVSVAVYRAAERTGDLGDAAMRLAGAARRRLAIGQKAVTLMIYPAVVLAISVIVSAVMLIVVVPLIGKALQDAEIDLPWYSQIVIGTGQWMRANLAIVGGGALAVVAGLIFGRKFIVAIVLSAARRLPAIARLQTAIEAARFFAIMGALTRTGVPVADALAVSSGTVSAPLLREQLETMRRRLVEGGLFRNLIEEVDELPLATRRLLVAAERSGDLETAFDGMAEDMGDEVARRSDRLMALLEPLLIVVMFSVIGTLLVSIMLPMMSAMRGAG
ncbi:MAG: type II secretion system F family protein [Phycisphaerales bacterium]|nr:type II secretion system F family protein [Phycisphaerales bacterium]